LNAEQAWGATARLIPAPARTLGRVPPIFSESKRTTPRGGDKMGKKLSFDFKKPCASHSSVTDQKKIRDAFIGTTPDEILREMAGLNTKDPIEQAIRMRKTIDDIVENKIALARFQAQVIADRIIAGNAAVTVQPLAPSSGAQGSTSSKRIRWPKAMRDHAQTYFSNTKGSQTKRFYEKWKSALPIELVDPARGIAPYATWRAWVSHVKNKNTPKIHP
jgi:hypothetical protein